MTGTEAALALARAGLLLAEALVFGTLVVRALAGNAPLRLDLRPIWWLLVALGLAWILLQSAALDGVAATWLVLRSTRVGHVALLRMTLWAGAAIGSARGWRAAVLPSGIAMALHGAAGHATADGDFVLQASVLVHVVAAGAWIGGLPALWVGLRDVGADRLVRRFSGLGVVCVVLLAATALVQGLDLAGGLAGLVGTEYGHLLLLKMALFAGLLLLAAHNQFELAGNLTRLRRWVVIEAVMGCVTLCAASLLSASPPGLHEQPWWPFAWRLDLSALAHDELRLEVQNAVLILALAIGLLVLATWLRRARVVLLLGSLAAVWFASPSLGLLLVPAEPTVFWEPSADATPQSIALGRAAYAMHCANCHGLYLRGDGPGSAGLAIPPADLTAPHLWDHPPGQVFWWISDGMRGPDGSKVMPGFADQIDARTRWALIDFLHANNPYGSVRAGVHRH